MSRKKAPYRSKVKVGVDADGKPINKWFRGKTRDEFETNKDRIIEYYIEGEGLEEDRLFGEYAVEWYRVRKEPFIAESTKDGYRTMLNRHVLPAFGDRKLRAIRPVELQEFVNRFAGQSKSQITNVISVLRGVFRAAKQDRLVRDNPADTLERPKATAPVEKYALTEDERQRVRNQFTAHEHGLYLAVMYYTGMRPGEVRGLQWGDIDWDNGFINVERDVDYAGGKLRVGELKTAASKRPIPLADDLRGLLKPQRQAPGAFIFPGKDGKPLAQATAQRMWIRLMVACDMAEPIPEEERKKYSKKDIRNQYKPKITPHVMRHNFITMCWEAGIDIMLTMKMVGHTDYETTRNIYTHLSERHLDNAKEQLNAMFGKAKPGNFSATHGSV